MTEKEKMLAGYLYDPFAKGEDLIELRTKARNLCRKYNLLNDEEIEERTKILKELLPVLNDGVYLQGPIQFDFGCNTYIGKNSYANFNFVVLDEAKITIGDNVFIGPNVSLVTAVHPLLAEERNLFLKEDEDDGHITNMEYTKPIVIEDNCWICSNVTIVGGVRIGYNSVIAAGSVVVKDIPPHSLAAGNPCKVIRKITKEDSVYLKKELFPEEK